MARTGDDPMIAIDDVLRTHRGPGGSRVTALSLPRLRVARGERLLVVGPNGAGKTTLLHLIAGLLRPDRGRVAVDGVELDRLREHRLDRFRAARIGYLVQGGALLDGLTAEQNVRVALRFGGVAGGEARRRAAALLERVGMAHRAAHTPPALSGGERQRVALARALANDPPLVLADEPGAALDPPTSARLLAELSALVDGGERTLVVVTHRPDEFPGEARRLALPVADGDPR